MINCEICDQEFKTQLGLEKHYTTLKHTTNSEMKHIKDTVTELQNENNSLHHEEEILNDKITCLKNELEISDLETSNLKKELKSYQNNIIQNNGIIEALTKKISELKKENEELKESIRLHDSKKNNLFNIFAIGGVGLSVFVYLVKDYDIIKFLHI